MRPGRLRLDRPLALALAIGAAGAAAGAAIGLPAAPLIGSGLAVSAAAWAGLTLDMDVRLRNLAFATIGISLGAGVDPSTMGRLGDWAASLALLIASVAATLVGGAWLLQRAYGQDRDTAILSSAPGTMSYALAMAADGRGEATTVLILQSLRLLLLATLLPMAIFALATPAPPPPPAATMGAIGMIAVLAATLAFGWLGTRMHWPAAYLIAGLALSGLAHATSLTEGRPPGWVLFAAFAVTGTTMGARFSGISVRAMLRLAGASLAVVGLAAAISGAFALLAASVTHLPAGQVWVAFAPGGVEAMAAIGLALDYDPAYIALHHLARILTLIVLMPLVLRPRRR